ncbi:unnamed protein product [Penicillium salamii]|uniref:ribonuclease H n=1 Tax=Penicillium salamii TaxID=1612424 RepID=A0A9W4JMT8_9EURO|nr:unnamed protein product [Penicillium salamii]
MGCVNPETGSPKATDSEAAKSETVTAQPLNPGAASFEAAKSDAVKHDAIKCGAIRCGAIKFGAVESDAVKSGAVESGAVESGAVESGAVESGAVEYGAVESGAVESGAVESGAVESDAVESRAVESEAIESEAIESEAVNIDAAITHAANTEAVNLDSVNPEATTPETTTPETATPEAITPEATTLEPTNFEFIIETAASDNSTDSTASETSTSIHTTPEPAELEIAFDLENPHLPPVLVFCDKHGEVSCLECTHNDSWVVQFMKTEGGDARPRLTNPHLTMEPPRIGTGLVFPQVFEPPNPKDTPKTLFPPGLGKNTYPYVHRFIRETNEYEFLVYTDGACKDSNTERPRGGIAFVYRETEPDVTGSAGFPLEKEGPTGQRHFQTSNRAQLRAVLAALRFRRWNAEGFTRMIIATDSEYAVKGMTEWTRGWVRKGWKTSNRQPVMNRDLWECILGEIERLDGLGLTVQFWWIAKEDNEEADRADKAASLERDRSVQFRDLAGASC